MYRLLIVDDEPAIVDGLVQHFQENEELELDICKAYTAFEALDIVKKTKIDIVLSDIRMPGKNGLQMIDDLLFYWPSCRIIFLTGYSEFDYIYSAIRKNIDHYLLKTEGLPAISDAVRDAVRKLEEEKRNSELLERAQQQMMLTGTLLERAQQQMMLTGTLLKKEMLEAILLGDSAAAVFADAGLGETEWNVHTDRRMILLAGKVDGSLDKYAYTQKLTLFYGIRSVLETQLPDSFRSEFLIHDHAVLVWYMQPDRSEERFRNAAGETDWRGMITYLKGILESVQNECRDRQGVSVSFAVSSGAVDWEEAGSHFASLRELMEKRALSGYKMAVIDPGMPDSLVKAEPAMLVDRIHRFIADNLGGDLSLVRIAEIVYFNPSYLSRFYKQTTGRNLTEYINAEKARAASDMLADMQLKINEIALRLGFESPSYFTSFFKKMRGATPQDFREAIVQRNNR
ncbi:response regulator [Paenibacillus sp. MBLB4367]|uniref:response regulator transcription factor n=1 Tax=Paenibacillus sp. MBLB4367 TaxID=3384767 RepID=UPI00390811C2